jgi:hypothetical protein
MLILWFLLRETRGAFEPGRHYTRRYGERLQQQQQLLPLWVVSLLLAGGDL